MLDTKELIAKLLNCDYIVDEGVSGDWTYRKWSSGLAECWYRADVGRITLNTALGTDRISESLRIPFPFPFTQIPSCVVGYEGNSTGYAWLEMANIYKTTVDYSYGVRLARIGTSNVTLENNIFTCHVVGRWK